MQRKEKSGKARVARGGYLRHKRKTKGVKVRKNRGCRKFGEKKGLRTSKVIKNS